MRSDAAQRILDLRQRGINTENDTAALALLLTAKSLAMEHGLASLMSDLMCDIGVLKHRINKRRKKAGLPLIPVSMFGGANLTVEELLKHDRR